jgi:superfamily II DNA helicase RecQ
VAPPPSEVSRASARAAVAATVEAEVDLEFEQGGYSLAVVEVGGNGVIAVPVGGRARTRIPFDSTVQVDGKWLTLVAPTGGGGGRGSRPSAADRAARAAAGTPEEQALREHLREWRRQRSQADAVPAYVVFSDATLDDIVARVPRTPDELLACSGIGPAKLDRFGDELLAAIDEAMG